MTMKCGGLMVKDLWLKIQVLGGFFEALKVNAWFLLA